MLDTYIIKINRTLENNDFIRLLSYVSEEKKKRISQFHLFEDAQRSLLGDVLARFAICKKLSVKNRDLVFGANEYGKPILNNPNRIHFNISHSGNWVVCAVDDNTVGIDVEVIKPIDFEIAERFFSKDEYITFKNQPDEMKLMYFYMIWTLKESYIKMEGKGLSIPLNSFTIRMENDDISVSVSNETQGFYFYQSFLGCNAVYAVCTIERNPNEIILLDVENLLKEVQGSEHFSV